MLFEILETKICCMKKGLLAFGLLLAQSSWAQFNTPSINGSIGAGEYGTHTSGQNQLTSGGITWFLTWDDTHLFIATTGYTNFGNDAMNLYIDTDPQIPVNGGANSNGSSTGPNFDGVTPNLPFRANFFAFLKSGYDAYRTSNGSGGWNSSVENTLTKNFNDPSDIAEIRIPWSAITGGSRPSSFNFLAYMSFSAGGLFSPVPTANPNGTAPNKVRYFTVSTTADVSATKPFSRESYCHVGGNATGFGSISVWDFTMNTASTSITRATGAGGVWNIANDFIINNGTISFGSSSNVVDVNGDVILNPSGTLTLSTAVGGDLRVAGDMTVNGTFNKNARAIFFDGSAAQNISSTSSIDLDFVFVENTGGIVTFEPALNIDNTFEINPGCRVVLNNNMTLNGTLTIEAASETSYGQLLASGTISGSGNVVHQRAVTGSTAGWRFFSPATSGTQNDLGTSPTFAFGGPANVINLTNTNPNSWQGVTGTTSTALVRGRGYALYFGTDGVRGSATSGTITTTGSIQTSNLTVADLTNGNSGSSFGWALVGNPFTSGFNFGDAANTKTNIDNSIWIWNPTAGGSGSYATYNYATATSSPGGALNGIIPPGQGFLIKVNSTSPVLTMAAAARTTSTPNAQMRTASLLNRMFLKVTNTTNSFSDETALVSLANASTSFESEVDALKLNSFTGNAVNISSVSSDNRKLAINTTPVWNDQLSIPVHLACTDAAAMSIEANLTEVESTLPVILEDRYLNRMHNLRNGAYTFSHVPAQADRFVVRFANLSTSVNESQLEKLLVYSAEEKLFIQGVDGTFELKMFDVQGKLVKQFNGNENQQIAVGDLTPGTYVVHVQMTEGVRTFKVIR